MHLTVFESWMVIIGICLTILVVMHIVRVCYNKVIDRVMDWTRRWKR